MTSIASPPRASAVVIIPRRIRAIQAGWSLVIQRSSAMVCRRRSLRKRAARPRSSTNDCGVCQAGAGDSRYGYAGRLRQFDCWRRGRARTRATVPMAACKPATSSAISASTRLGAVLRSWPRRMSLIRSTTRRAATGGADATPGAGHPSDQWGYAVGAGLRLNFPMIAQGDYFQSQVNYTQGALRYLFFTPNTNWGKTEGSNETFGVLSDCVYGGAPGAAAATDDGLSADHGLGLQRVLRTLLDSCGA